MAPTDPMRRAYAGACKDLATVVANWRGLNGNELTAFNEVLTRNNLKPVPPANPALIAPACPTGAPTRAPSGNARMVRTPQAP